MFEIKCSSSDYCFNKYRKLNKRNCIFEKKDHLVERVTSCIASGMRHKKIGSYTLQWNESTALPDNVI